VAQENKQKALELLTLTFNLFVLEHSWFSECSRYWEAR
jgi:hypothetical protein